MGSTTDVDSMTLSILDENEEDINGFNNFILPFLDKSLSSCYFLLFHDIYSSHNSIFLPSDGFASDTYVAANVEKLVPAYSRCSLPGRYRKCFQQMGG